MYTITLKHRTTGNENFYKSGISEADLIKECVKAENIDPNWAYRAVISTDTEYFEDDMDLQDIEDGEDEYYAYCD